MNKIAVKTFWFFVNPIRNIYWFIFRPKTKGVKCLVISNKKILLVKLNYAHKSWTIPGGGVKRNESFIEAAKREVFEEAGIKIKNIKYKYSYQNTRQYKRDTVGVCIAQSNEDQISVDGIEVSEAGWFSIKQLPEDRFRSVDKILNGLGLI